MDIRKYKKDKRRARMIIIVAVIICVASIYFGEKHYKNKISNSSSSDGLILLSES